MKKHRNPRVGPTDENDAVLYLYGVMPRDRTVPDAIVPGLRRVSHENLVALVSPLPSREFSPAVLDEKLQRLEFVAPLAREHEAVLEKAMKHGPVVPAQLCTLFSSEDAVRESLAENEARFAEILGHIDGREEWQVKVYSDETHLRQAAASEDDDARAIALEAANATPGRAFVLGKRLYARVAEVASTRLDRAIDRIVATLETVACDIETRPPGAACERAVSEPVLRIVLLVEEGDRALLNESVEDLAAEFHRDGFAFELSGPWPAYSFRMTREEAT